MAPHYGSTDAHNPCRDAYRDYYRDGWTGAHGYSVPFQNQSRLFVKGRSVRGRDPFFMPLA